MQEEFRQAADKIRLWREKPQVMVRELFGVTPDKWQDEALEAFPHNQRMAWKACKGPGKTAVLSWLAWNFLLTRLHAKVAATSITSDNLSDGLWTEMAKWQKTAPLLDATFKWTKTRITCNDSPETWWMSARTWPKGGSADQQADTLAGLHADNLLFILDEAGGIPDAVMAAAEAGLANAHDGNEAHIIMAGNPTHLEGPLYRACTSERDLWHLTEITADPDAPNRTPRVSVQWAQEQIKKYGADNPWVLVNVFGKFPPSSMNALLGPDDVNEAMTRHYDSTEYSFASKVMGVDVAREGDDRSVIFPRQGLAAFKPKILRNVNSIQGAGQVARSWKKWGADGCFVDNTGGFGSGWIDQLTNLGYSPTGVHFSGKALNPMYANKRAEMWYEMAEWVKAGGALPNLPELVGELTTTTYFFKGDRIQMLEKDQVKQTLGRSPDLADALALTFAHPVHPKATNGHKAHQAKAVTEYDPFKDM